MVMAGEINEAKTQIARLKKAEIHRELIEDKTNE